MVALGLVILVLSGALTLGVVLSNTDPVAASAFGVSLSNVTVGGLFLVGAVAGLALMLGLTLMAMGAGRRRAKRVRTKHQVRDVRTEKEQLEQENAELRARLDGQPYPHDDATSHAGVSGTGDSADSTGTSEADGTGRHGLFHR